MMAEADKLFCIDPEAIGLEEVSAEIVAWLQGCDKRLGEPAFLLASEALRDNYPCPEQDSKAT